MDWRSGARVRETSSVRPGQDNGFQEESSCFCMEGRGSGGRGAKEEESLGQTLGKELNRQFTSK